MLTGAVMMTRMLLIPPQEEEPFVVRLPLLNAFNESTNIHSCSSL